MTVTPLEMKLRTIKLQEQFICPIWTLWTDKGVSVHADLHNAKQREGVIIDGKGNVVRNSQS